MKPINVHLDSNCWERPKTSDEGEGAVRGAVFLGTEKCSSELIINKLLSNFDALKDWAEIMQPFNGFYAMVACRENKLIAGVDRVRSIPLFYAIKNDQLFLSDDAEWVRQSVGDVLMDGVARTEFQTAGYVTGMDTLLPSVKQLQAGELICVDVIDKGIKIECQRYYRFLHKESPVRGPEVLSDAFRKAIEASIDRLIRYASGRQVVVPLSGGYDSRLIALLLKQRNYHNVLTFTYGTAGNKESTYSKHVAESLGLRWHFVEYTRAAVREAWLTAELWAYQTKASGWSSVSHAQDWLAVKEMKDKKILESNCVFVPGHSGDFVAGSHIPERAFSDAPVDLAWLIRDIMDVHFSIAPIKLERDRVGVSERIHDQIKRDSICSKEDYADAFESWDWQERQAKYIVNSVRVYEFFGCDWWLPFWDHEVLEFWEHMPLTLRRDRSWYVEYVRLMCAPQISVGGGGELKNATDSGVLRRLFRSRVKHLLVQRGSRGKAIYDLIKKVMRRHADHLVWRSQFRKRDVRKLVSDGYSMVGINSYMLLKRLEADLGTLNDEQPTNDQRRVPGLSSNRGVR